MIWRDVALYHQYHAFDIISFRGLLSRIPPGGVGSIEMGKNETLDLKKNGKCSFCELLVGLFDLALDVDRVDDCVEWVINLICEYIEDDNVCAGIVSGFGVSLPIKKS